MRSSRNLLEDYISFDFYLQQLVKHISVCHRLRLIVMLVHLISFVFTKHSYVSHSDTGSNKLKEFPYVHRTTITVPRMHQKSI